MTALQFEMLSLWRVQVAEHFVLARQWKQQTWFGAATLSPINICAYSSTLACPNLLWLAASFSCFIRIVFSSFFYTLTHNLISIVWVCALSVPRSGVVCVHTHSLRNNISLNVWRRPDFDLCVWLTWVSVSVNGAALGSSSNSNSNNGREKVSKASIYKENLSIKAFSCRRTFDQCGLVANFMG